MQAWLRARILAATGMSALVGPRVDWGAAKQGDPMPRIEMHVISDPPDMNMAGPSGWSAARVQADVRARSVTEAKAVADLIVPLFNGVRIDTDALRTRSFVLDRSSSTESDKAGIIHRVQIDLQVWHTP